MEENRYTCGIREYYKLRKETIERNFALAKELHGFRYTQEYGQARMVWKAALTFACINLKKLAKMTWSAPKTLHIPRTFVHYLHDFISSLKTPPACSPAGGVCLQPEAHAEACAFIIWCVSPHMRRERTGFSHYSPLSGGRGCSGEKKSPKRPEMEEADRNGKK